MRSLAPILIAAGVATLSGCDHAECRRRIARLESECRFLEQDKAQLLAKLARLDGVLREIEQESATAEKEHSRLRWKFTWQITQFVLISGVLATGTVVLIVFACRTSAGKMACLGLIVPLVSGCSHHKSCERRIERLREQIAQLKSESAKLRETITKRSAKIKEAQSDLAALRAATDRMGNRVQLMNCLAKRPIRSTFCG